MYAKRRRTGRARGEEPAKMKSNGSDESQITEVNNATSALCATAVQLRAAQMATGSKENLTTEQCQCLQSGPRTARSY